MSAATDRAREEFYLPPIFPRPDQRDPATGERWPEAYYTERIEWYTRLTIGSGIVRGGCGIIPEFIAAMIWESGLDNIEPGNNARTGTPFDSPNWSSLGTGWLQLDTNHNVRDLTHMHELRADPLAGLLYAADPANGLCEQRPGITLFRKQLWHAWEWDTIAPEEGWSAYTAAQDAYRKVVAEDAAALRG